jgi:hypothetical protein
MRAPYGRRGPFHDRGVLMQSKSVARLVRLGKRSLLIALLGLVLTAAIAPGSALPGGLPHIVHVQDGQGDSPLVP